MHVIVPKVLELILAGIISGSELVSSPNRDPDSRDQRTRSITYGQDHLWATSHPPPRNTGLKLMHAFEKIV